MGNKDYYTIVCDINEIITDQELEPCPFCGGNADIRTYEDDGSLVHCTKCDALIEYWFKTEEEAADAWNRRA